MQGLTPTRRGNVPGSLSTYRQAFGGILIFMDAPCLPSLHCTHTDSYQQLQAESNELQQWPEPGENYSSPSAFPPVVSGHDFIWNLI